MPKEGILETVWPDVVVSEASLATLAKDVRKALGLPFLFQAK